MKHVENEKNIKENAEKKTNYLPMLGFLVGSILFLAATTRK